MSMSSNQQNSSLVTSSLPQAKSSSGEAGSNSVVSKITNLRLQVRLEQTEPIQTRPDQQIRCKLVLQIPEECTQFQSVRIGDAHSTNEHSPQLRVKVFVTDGAAEIELLPNVCRHCSSRSRGQTVRLHSIARLHNGDVVLSRSNNASPGYYSATGEFALSISCSSSHWGSQAINGYRLEFTLYTSDGRLIGSYNPDQRVTIVQKRKDRGSKDTNELAAKRRCQDSPNEVIPRPHDNLLPISRDNVQPALTKIYPAESDIKGGERVTLKVNLSLDGSVSYFVHFGFYRVKAYRFAHDILTCEVPAVQSAGLVAVFVTTTGDELEAGQVIGSILFRYTAQEASFILEPEGASIVGHSQQNSTYQGHPPKSITPRYPSLPVLTSKSESSSSTRSQSTESSSKGNKLQSESGYIDPGGVKSSKIGHSSPEKDNYNLKLSQMVAALARVVRLGSCRASKTKTCSAVPSMADGLTTLHLAYL